MFDHMPKATTGYEEGDLGATEPDEFQTAHFMNDSRSKMEDDRRSVFK